MPMALMAVTVSVSMSLVALAVTMARMFVPMAVSMSMTAAVRMHGFNYFQINLFGG